jgi:hypothetical protein
MLGRERREEALKGVMWPLNVLENELVKTGAENGEQTVGVEVAATLDAAEAATLIGAALDTAIGGAADAEEE